jgi:hypothetical protein
MGGSGDDTYIVDSGDTVVEKNAGTDTVLSVHTSANVENTTGAADIDATGTNWITSSSAIAATIVSTVLPGATS